MVDIDPRQRGARSCGKPIFEANCRREGMCMLLGQLLDQYNQRDVDIDDLLDFLDRVDYSAVNCGCQDQVLEKTDDIREEIGAPTQNRNIF